VPALWITIASTLLAIAALLLSAALWTQVRVLGRVSEVERSLLLLVTKIEQLDERLTREVKQRAALAGAAEREDARSISEQAAAVLAREGNSAAPLGRPSRSIRR